MSESEFAQYVSDESVLYYLVDDYDADGLNEAFVFTQESGGHYDESFGLYSDVNMYFLSSAGDVTFLEDTYGFLTEDIITTYDGHKFVQWCKYAGGSSSSTIIYGVMNGKAYQPEISGKYLEEYDSINNLYKVIEEYGEDASAYEFHTREQHIEYYDASTGEFIDTGKYIITNLGGQEIERNF